ncbi:MAG: tetratricopeptide repeat protein, partial [Aeromonas sp.]
PTIHPTTHSLSFRPFQMNINELSEQDDQQIEQVFKNATEANHAQAQYLLGVMYEKGHAVVQDAKQAVHWYHKAAQQGHAQAQYLLGLMYALGKGVAYDAKEVVYWYQKAAEQGNASAQNKLGLMYCNGLGVPLDYGQAYAWCAAAAANGDVEAIALRDAIATKLKSTALADAKQLGARYFEQYQPR